MILNITVCTEASVTRHIPLVEEILGEDANDVQKIDAAAAIILLLLESVKKQTFSLTYSAAATWTKATEAIFYDGLKLPDIPIYETKSERRKKAL